MNPSKELSVDVGHIILFVLLPIAASMIGWCVFMKGPVHIIRHLSYKFLAFSYAIEAFLVEYQLRYNTLASAATDPVDIPSRGVLTSEHAGYMRFPDKPDLPAFRTQNA